MKIKSLFNKGNEDSFFAGRNILLSMFVRKTYRDIEKKDDKEIINAVMYGKVIITEE